VAPVAPGAVPGAVLGGVGAGGITLLEGGMVKPGGNRFWLGTVGAPVVGAVAGGAAGLVLFCKYCIIICWIGFMAGWAVAAGFPARPSN